MASSKEYLEFILGQLSELEEITYRAMMGEFIIYYRGKIVGGIYDDRLLVKPVKAAISYMPTAPYELPYVCLQKIQRIRHWDFIIETTITGRKIGWIFKNILIRSEK